MEELTPLLEKLAEKLGTTTEYLWDVLIKQAPITAMTELLYLVLVILGGVVIYKVYKKDSSEVDTISLEEEYFLINPMFIIFMVWCVLFLSCFFSIGAIVNGFFNPEYWALKEIVSLIQ